MSFHLLFSLVLSFAVCHFLSVLSLQIFRGSHLNNYPN
nr:MAG TPA_asm: hypothetical protein [Caudoviricetes sp.]